LSFGRAPLTRPQNREGGAGRSEKGTLLMPRVFRQQYTRPIPSDAKHVTVRNKKGEVVPAVRFRGSDGKMITAPVVQKGNGAGKTCRVLSPNYSGHVKGQRVTLCTNKEAAEVMLADLIRRAERGGVGMCDPFERHSKRPLSEHVADYRRELEARGNASRYADLVASRLGDLLAGCGFCLTADLSASRVSDWLARLREMGRPRAELEPAKVLWTRKELAGLLGIKPASVPPLVRRHRLSAEGNGKARRYPRATIEALQDLTSQGVSVATTNQYLAHLKSFCNWMVKDGRMGSNPFLHVEPGNADVDRRHDRRELTTDELRGLLAAARGSDRSFRGLTGWDRFHLYATACATGFRAMGLASLTPESFDLDGDTPTVTLAARRNKSRRLKVQPLPADIADLLRQYLEGRPAGQPVWPGTWATLRVGADMLRIDLDTAGIPYAVEGPDGPLYADFHALRHSYLTLGGRAGIDLRTLQELAGHSTSSLTERYSHRRLHDLAGAVEKLPSLLPVSAVPGEDGDMLRATGTDGAPPDSGDKSTLRTSPPYTPLTQFPGEGRGTLRIAEEGAGAQGIERDKPQTRNSQGFEACRGAIRTAEERAGDRIRTGDVQLGKLGFNSAEKCRTPLLEISLGISVTGCKRVRRLASTCQKMQKFCIPDSGMQKNAESIIDGCFPYIGCRGTRVTLGPAVVDDEHRHGPDVADLFHPDDAGVHGFRRVALPDQLRDAHKTAAGGRKEAAQAPVAADEAQADAAAAAIDMPPEQRKRGQTFARLAPFHFPGAAMPLSISCTAFSVCGASVSTKSTPRSGRTRLRPASKQAPAKACQQLRPAA
jgi:integrase